MSDSDERRRQLVSALVEKEYRDLYSEAHVATGLGFQLRAMRKARGWTQTDLATRSGCSQACISAIERITEPNATLGTLQRLAAAFDVALVVRFVPFSELVDWSIRLSPEMLAVPDFDHDPGLGLTAGGHDAG